MVDKIKRFLTYNSFAPLLTVVCNLVLAYVVYFVCRIVFLLTNYSSFSDNLTAGHLMEMLRGGFLFDSSAIMYTNVLWIVMVLFPLHLKETPTYRKVCKWLFVVVNSIGVALNLGDAVYVAYTGRRSTVTVFSEFVNENNIASIFLTEFVNHWYLVLLFVVIVALMWLCYRTPDKCVWGKRWRYYVAQTVTLLVLAPLAIIGIRGSATAGTRPITISNANEYVNRPIEGTLVLNTPFSIIRSIGKKVFVTPDYMSMEEMRRTYEPIITPVNDSLTTSQKKNVVVIIVESMGKEYIGSLNPDLEGGKYKGYMPFMDSLLTKSLTFEYTFANGRISMDAMPSVLSGIPMMVEPFFLTPASLNDVGGLPKMLKPRGYFSAFFHGGHNISMGFSAFAHAIGYEKYFGLNEYCDSPKYGGMTSTASGRFGTSHSCNTRSTRLRSLSSRSLCRCSPLRRTTPTTFQSSMWGKSLQSRAISPSTSACATPTWRFASFLSVPASNRGSTTPFSCLWLTTPTKTNTLSTRPNRACIAFLSSSTRPTDRLSLA